MSITVRMSNHSPYVKSLCNRHIKQYSHMDTSIFTHASITTTSTVQVTHFISNLHPNPLNSMNRTYTLLSASRSRTKLDDGTQGFTKFTHHIIDALCAQLVKATLPQFSTISVSHIQLLQYLERNTITSCISDTIQRTHRPQCHRIDITEVNVKKNMF